MYLNTLILFIICSAIAYFFHKKIVSPSFIVPTVWGILIFIYENIDHGLYPLTNQFYIALQLWVISFWLISMIFTCLNFKVNKYVKRPSPNYNVFKKGYKIFLICNLIIIAFMIVLSRNYGSSIPEGMRNLTIYHKENIPTIFSLLLYVYTIGNIISIIYLFHNKTIEKKYIFLFITQIIILFLFGNKGTLICYFFAIFFYFYHKKLLKLKTIFLFILFFLCSIYIITASRDNATELFEISELIAIYLLSPLTAFDSLLNGDVNVNEGGTAVFTFIANFLNKFGFEILSIKETPGWVNVPLPTNVYTCMYAFYADFRYTGIALFGAIYGCIWGILFNIYRRGYSFAAILYALFIYIPIVSFFGDYFMNMLSYCIQFLIITLYMFSRIKFKFK